MDRQAHEPNDPPHYRVQKDPGIERCATCTMFDQGDCWGYGNTPVEEDGICDSYYRDGRKTAATPQLVDLNDGSMGPMHPSEVPIVGDGYSGKLYVGGPGWSHGQVFDKAGETDGPISAKHYRGLIDTESGQYSFLDGKAGMPYRFHGLLVNQGYKPSPGVLSRRQANTQTSWHLTDNPQFALDPEFSPQDNTFSIEDRSNRKGLYTGDPEHWRNGYDYVRPFVAEIEHPPADPERWGGENFLPAEQFPHSTVKRVIPYDAWTDEHYYNKPYTGPDVREMTPEQIQVHQQAARDEIVNNRPHMLSIDAACPACGDRDWLQVSPRENHADCKSCGKQVPVDPEIYEQARYGSRTANILDPIHDTLDPTVWLHPQDPEPVLKPEHRHWIITTITAALKKHGYDGMDEWLSLVLTGSLTTYQYGEHSDCDVSLFVDAPKFPDWSRAEMIAVLVEEFDDVKLPGTTHPLQAFVVDTNKLSKEDLYKPGLRSGYDLSTQQWIVPPEKGRSHDVEHEQNGDYTYALEVADKMEHLLRYEPDKAVKYYQMLHKRRARDQANGKGDYSQANIVYKMLDNRKLFDQLRKLGVPIA